MCTLYTEGRGRGARGRSKYIYEIPQRRKKGFEAKRGLNHRNSYEKEEHISQTHQIADQIADRKLFLCIISKHIVLKEMRDKCVIDSDYN